MNIPQLLILSRLVLAPCIILIAFFYEEKSVPYIITLMYVGLITDIFDGIIARKQNISNEKLRRLDSQVDIIFWIAIGTSAWILRSGLLQDQLTGFWIILCLEIACYAISFVKFKKETCTHAILSKIWGLSILVAFTALIGFKTAGAFYYTCIILGTIAQTDVILIMLILPKWTHDIPSCYHAYKIRKGIPIKRHKLFNG